jgi:hypothetical protein
MSQDDSLHCNYVKYIQTNSVLLNEISHLWLETGYIKSLIYMLYCGMSAESQNYEANKDSHC